jgi:hypothetical protein
MRGVRHRKWNTRDQVDTVEYSTRTLVRPCYPLSFERLRRSVRSGSWTGLGQRSLPLPLPLPLLRLFVSEGTWVEAVPRISYGEGTGTLALVWAANEKQAAAAAAAEAGAQSLVGGTALDLARREAAVRSGISGR